MNKKALFFTLMSMLLIALITFALISPPKNVAGVERIDPVVTRIQSLNDMVSAMNGMYIRSIVLVTAYNELQSIASTLPLPADNTALQSAFKTALESTNDDSKSIRYWFRKLNDSAYNAYHSSLILKKVDIKSLTQQDNEPYTFSVQLDLDYSVNEEDKDVYWNVSHKNLLIKGSIIGLPDPDNGGAFVVPKPEGLYEHISGKGKSYLAKLNGLTVYTSNTLCPGSLCT